MSLIRFPPGFKMSDYLASGITGMIYLDTSSNTVVKYPHQESDEPAVEIERRIYERFQQSGGHSGLLKYYGALDVGIRLQYASNNGIRQYLQTHAVNDEQRMEWTRQLINTIAFVHSQGIIHADLTCGNISLDDTLHTKLLDFSGSSLDGSEPSVVVTASHRCPHGDLKTTRADIFALGSTLYEIMTSEPPFHAPHLQEADITRRIRQSSFPDTSNLGLMGDVIVGCWHGRFGTAEEVLAAIEHPSKPQWSAPSILETTVAVSCVSLLVFLVHRLAKR